MTRLEDTDYYVPTEVADEADLQVDYQDTDALKQVSAHLKKRILHYRSVDSIDITGKTELSAIQQIAVAKTVVHELSLMKSVIDQLIAQAKEEMEESE